MPQRHGPALQSSRRLFRPFRLSILTVIPPMTSSTSPSSATTGVDHSDAYVLDRHNHHQRQSRLLLDPGQSARSAESTAFRTPTFPSFSRRREFRFLRKPSQRLRLRTLGRRQALANRLDSPNLFPCHTVARRSRDRVSRSSFSHLYGGARRGLYPVSRKIFITYSSFPQTIHPGKSYRRASGLRGTAELRTWPTAPASDAQYNCILGANRWKALERTLRHASLRNPQFRGLLKTGLSAAPRSD